MGRKKGGHNKPKVPPGYRVDWATKTLVPDDQGPPPAPTVQMPDTFEKFLEVAKIKAKRGGKLVKAELFEEQLELVEEWLANPDKGLNLLVLKARQLGITTLMALLFFYKWLTSSDPVRLVHIAHKQTTAKEIMKMHKTIWSNLPDEIRPKLTTDTKSEMVREGGAEIAVFTAGLDGGIRGGTAWWLHVTEAAFCRAAFELKAAAFNTVPGSEGGRIVMESTANHPGDVVHEEMKKSVDPETAATVSEDSQWQAYFFPWFGHSKYRSPPRSDFEPTQDELVLIELYGLDHEQLQWRRNKISQIGIRVFRREFPCTIDEAYSGISGLWIDQSRLQHVEVKTIQPFGITFFEKYIEGEPYALALDPCGGVGEDFAAGVVRNVRTKRPVAFYRHNLETPGEQARQVFHLAKIYGNCLILVERNDFIDNRFGTIVLQTLRELGAKLYRELSHEFDGLGATGDGHDFVTTKDTKVEVLSAFKEDLYNGSIAVVDNITWDELASAKIDLAGNIIFPRTANGHGDMAYAQALVGRCARHVAIPQARRLPNHIHDQEESYI